MKKENIMDEEMRNLIKRLSIRMVDAMELWGDEKNPQGAKPKWEEKEHAMTEYMSSRQGIMTLLSVVYKHLNSLPEGTETVGLVTVKFVVATCKLLEDLCDLEYPEEKAAGAQEATAAEDPSVEKTK